jgi:hypothetical protein
MKITYGYKWFRPKRRLTETWDESRARKSHEKRQLYVAVVGEASSPTCFVEINNKYVGVGFLDALVREYLCYTFDEVEPGRLFLSEATHREFDGDSDKVSRGETYIFKQDGSVRVEKENFLENSHSVAESKMDVTGNWDAYPSFGRYESIIRKSR